MPGLQTYLQRSMAGFFYRYGPTKGSLYAKLARRIGDASWHGAIATLNYERMLPLALARAGMSTFFGPRPDWGAHLTEICLPHGCCHLFCDSVMASAAHARLDGRAVTTNGPVTAVDDPREFWLRIRTQALPPVMSYFEPSKFTTSGANFIEEQRTRLRQLISDADSIAVVGIAVREQDTHIWDILAKTSAPIYYCSGSSAKPIFETWASKHRARAKDIVSGGYWRDDFDAIADHIGC
jgi:hypothetical protein